MFYPSLYFLLCCVLRYLHQLTNVRYDCFGNRNIHPVYHMEQNQNSHGEHRIVSINWNYVVLKYQYSDNIYIDAFLAIYTLYLTFASTQHCHQRLQRIYNRTVYACFHLLTKFYFLPERKLSHYLPLINDSISSKRTPDCLVNDSTIDSKRIFCFEWHPETASVTVMQKFWIMAF